MRQLQRSDPARFGALLNESLDTALAEYAIFPDLP